MRLSTYPFGRLLLLAGLLLSLAAPRPAQATTELRGQMAKAAQVIKKYLDGQNQHEIVVGQFSGPPNFPASSGPGIALTLAEELKKLGIDVTKQRAKLGIKGEYSAMEVPSEEDKHVKLMALKINGKVVDEFGNEVLGIGFEQKIRGEDSLLKLLGMSVELPSPADPRDRDRILRDQFTGKGAFDRGKARVTPTQAASGPKETLVLELLVQDRPRPVRTEDGLDFVTIHRNEKYAVRLINNSDQELAVQLSIDGLSMFAFSTIRNEKGDPKFSVVFVGPHVTYDVRGWFRTLTQSDSFMVTEYARSARAVANLTPSADVGTITATYAAAWPETADPPADEQPKKKGGSQGDATGFGPPVRTKLDVVKRSIGTVRGAVSVRYKTK